MTHDPTQELEVITVNLGLQIRYDKNTRMFQVKQSFDIPEYQGCVMPIRDVEDAVIDALCGAAFRNMAHSIALSRMLEDPHYLERYRNAGTDTAIAMEADLFATAEALLSEYNQNVGGDLARALLQELVEREARPDDEAESQPSA